MVSSSKNLDKSLREIKDPVTIAIDSSGVKVLRVAVGSKGSMVRRNM